MEQIKERAYLRTLKVKCATKDGSPSPDVAEQGDLTIYRLKDGKPDLALTPVEGTVLVVGQGGNHHSVRNAKEILRTEHGAFVVVAGADGVEFTHEQHKPPIFFEGGTFLVTRGREKEMFGDMVNPIAD
jgi:hypothetical protein